MFDPLTEEGSLIVSLRRELHVTQVQRDQYKLNWLELERINKLLDQKCQLLLAQRDNRSKEFEALQQRGKAVASDNIKLVPDQIAPWVPGGLDTLGTDGFGRSDTRENLRRFFEIDAECTVIATLYSLAKKGEIEMKVVAQAIKDLEVDPEKAFPKIV